MLDCSLCMVHGNGLQPNADKSEVINHHHSGHSCPATLFVGCRSLQSTSLEAHCRSRHNLVKSLGVILDNHMHFDSHVGAVVRACNYHTPAPRHARNQLTAQTRPIACNYRVPDRLLQLTVVRRSCCSYRQTTKGTKQRRSCHLSTAQTQ